MVNKKNIVMKPAHRRGLQPLEKVCDKLKLQIHIKTIYYLKPSSFLSAAAITAKLLTVLLSTVSPTSVQVAKIIPPS